MDSIVQSVIDKHVSRASKGKEKYGVTLDREDLTLSEWLTHAQEEMMDGALYLEKIKQVNDKQYSEFIEVMLNLMALTMNPKHVTAFEDWLNHPNEAVPFNGEKPIISLQQGDLSKVKLMLDWANNSCS